MDNYRDEYDAYDLSEFSTEDFARIDATTREHDRHATAPDNIDTGVAWRRRVDTSGSGGPQIAVALESVADESVVVKVAREDGGNGSEHSIMGAAQNADDRGMSDPAFKADAHSPFEEFRSYGTLSVSDLVGPAWYVLSLVTVGRV